jgi:hypothetical protein
VNHVNLCTDRERVENNLESTSNNSSNSTTKRKRKPAVSAIHITYSLLAASPAAHVS